MSDVSRKTRTVVLLRRDVASRYWRGTWDEVVAAAEAHEDGVQLAEQPLTDSGTPLHEWTEGPKESPVRRQIAPVGWACHYAFLGKPFLHFQNY